MSPEGSFWGPSLINFTSMQRMKSSFGGISVDSSNNSTDSNSQSNYSRLKSILKAK